ncbi:MAG: glycosyltransferase [Ignavibacteriae bacterium]|nr:glycosyltransferase [Ignavibacteria bacterium]MBI3365945.1 glycosyltransferase [Ignavibacteriota bacterium]
MHRKSPPGRSRDCISITERVITWLLVFVGSEAILYFAIWWFDPEHHVRLVFFVPLSFATFWLMYESSIYWFYLLGLKIPERRPPGNGITVDVFTTAAPGEPAEMFEKALPALVAITYPHKTYLLDGSGNPQLKTLAERFAVERIDCTDVGGAKAGKINYALKQTSGEIILVIDPDHIAEPHFLDTVLGHFEDRQVGFVQVVQAYYNQSASFVARAAAEQTYGFYGQILMGMNGYGSPLVIGANCTFRRKALESIGGHAVHLVEDFVTSLRLHAEGWNSVYVPEIVARGLVPEDINSYFNQQLKWATGMFQVLFTMLPKIVVSLKGWQKLCYLMSSTYYFVGLAISVNLVLPVVFLFFGIWAVEMPIRGYMIHLIPFAATFLIIHRYSQKWMRDRSERGWQWRGLLLKLGSWPIYLLSLLFAMLGIKVSYLPTSKKRQRGIFPLLVLPHILIVVLSVASIAWGLHSPLRDFDGTKLMIFFAALNSLLMLPTIAAAFSALFQRGQRSQ